MGIFQVIRIDKSVPTMNHTWERKIPEKAHWFSYLEISPTRQNFMLTVNQLLFVISDVKTQQKKSTITR